MELRLRKRKQGNSTKVERENGLGIRNLPTGVQERNGRFRARITHPKLKTMVWLGTFGTLEEACTAIKNKREEFGCKKPLMMRPNHNEICRRRRPLNNDRVEFVIGLAAMEKESDEFGEREELPDGVRPTKTGRWGAWLKDPISGIECFLCSYKTVKEAAIAVQRNRAKVEKIRAEINIDDRVVDDPREPECGFDQIGSPSSGFEAEKRAKIDVDGGLDNPGKPECGFDQTDSTSSVLEAESLREELVESDEIQNTNNDQVLDNPEKPGCGCDHVDSREKLSESNKRENTSTDRVVDIINPEKPECGIGQIGSPTSVMEAEKSSDEPVWKSTSFDEWVKLGIINEYGQFLGEYSKLDDVLWFDSHCEDEATSTVMSYG